jgi:hypothetical protein
VYKYTFKKEKKELEKKKKGKPSSPRLGQFWLVLCFSPPDEDITSIHTMNGPITRSHARQLNLQVRSTLVNCVSELILGAMDVLMIRNLGED